MILRCKKLFRCNVILDRCKYCNGLVFLVFKLFIWTSYLAFKLNVTIVKLDLSIAFVRITGFVFISDVYMRVFYI